MSRFYSRFVSFLICGIVYVVAYVATKFFVENYKNFINALWLILFADLLATVIVYAFSVRFRNASLYDPYWSVAPPVIASYWVVMGNENFVGQAMLIVIIVWSVRLTLNWARGWKGLPHEDWRYVMLRSKNPRFYWLTNLFGIHLFPTAMVFLGMLPVYFTTISTDTSLLKEGFTIGKAIFFLGFAISFFATVIELVADEQMISFKRGAKPGEIINEGIWRYSRHPNYFGEICFWLGLWIMQMSVAPHYWWTVIGFVAILLMFIFASIPMMENKNKSSKANYDRYVKETPMLVPFKFFS